MRPGLTLVVSPLVSLIQDQIHHLQEAGVNAAYLSGTQQWQEQRAIMDECVGTRVMAQHTCVLDTLRWVAVHICPARSSVDDWI
jgi:superfamily II DNA helicase RecQ